MLNLKIFIFKLKYLFVFFLMKAYENVLFVYYFFSMKAYLNEEENKKVLSLFLTTMNSCSCVFFVRWRI